MSVTGPVASGGVIATLQSAGAAGIGAVGRNMSYLSINIQADIRYAFGLRYPISKIGIM